MKFFTDLWGSFVIGYKKHLTTVLIIIGILGLILVAVFSKEINTINLYGIDFSKMLTNVLSAILGAGVFAAIMKSAQFTSIFQKNIYEVLYRPQEVYDFDSLLYKWKNLTKIILKANLPEDYEDAANKIIQHYIDGDIHYHFENYEAKYDVQIEKTGNRFFFK